MEKYERSCAFDCPKCKEKIYIPVEYVANTVTCTHCNSKIDITPEMRVQLTTFKELSDFLVK